MARRNGVARTAYRSIRGRSVALVIFDELAFWRDETGSNPDAQVYRAVTSGCRRCAQPRDGHCHQHRLSACRLALQQEHPGQDGDIFAILQPSIVFRPTLDQAEIYRDLEEDYERFSAEWLSIWRSDLGDLFDRELIEASVDRGVQVRLPRSHYSYRGKGWCHRRCSANTLRMTM
ncbi:MAG: hypothetical protein J2P48_04750 [Alphaproteobacteria bacterium]|nr:hypothetical protein [Alphaproteobacteria bacterium]